MYFFPFVMKLERKGIRFNLHASLLIGSSFQQSACFRGCDCLGWVRILCLMNRNAAAWRNSGCSRGRVAVGVPPHALCAFARAAYEYNLCLHPCSLHAFSRVSSERKQKVLVSFRTAVRTRTNRGITSPSISWIAL